MPWKHTRVRSIRPRRCSGNSGLRIFRIVRIPVRARRWKYFGINCCPSGGFSGSFSALPNPILRACLRPNKLRKLTPRGWRNWRGRGWRISRGRTTPGGSRRAHSFDVERQRIGIFWRRVLHSAHHRTQLTVYLRLLGKPVVSTYGPTADITWKGADPTLG